MHPTFRRLAHPSLLMAVSLGVASAAHAQDGAATGFEPGMLALGITGLFAVATLVTGLGALFGNTGWSLLIRTQDFTVVGSTEVVTAPNVRGWGVRQVVTGVPLWAALLLGHQVLFQVAIACVLVRQALDIMMFLLDGEPKKTALFWAAAVPTLGAFVSVL